MKTLAYNTSKAALMNSTHACGRVGRLRHHRERHRTRIVPVEDDEGVAGQVIAGLQSRLDGFDSRPRLQIPLVAQRFFTTPQSAGLRSGRRAPVSDASMGGAAEAHGAIAWHAGTGITC